MFLDFCFPIRIIIIITIIDMIICGYAGIGKSYLAKNFPNVIYLDPMPFDGNWDMFAKCAIYYHEKGYLVLLPFNTEIRARIVKNVAPCVAYTIVPDPKDKNLYQKRFEKGQQYSQEFIEEQMKNWEKEIANENSRMIGETWVNMKPDENLLDAIVRIEAEAKEWYIKECKKDYINFKEEFIGDRYSPLAPFINQWNQKAKIKLKRK